jgi:hypothetical protein
LGYFFFCVRHFDDLGCWRKALEGTHPDPVATFAKQGCGGCHEDVHTGQLGNDCTRCHQEQTWSPVGQIALHQQTRFQAIRENPQPILI